MKKTKDSLMAKFEKFKLDKNNQSHIKGGWIVLKDDGTTLDHGGWFEAPTVDCIDDIIDCN